MLQGVQQMEKDITKLSDSELFISLSEKYIKDEALNELLKRRWTHEQILETILRVSNLLPRI